MYNLDKQQLDPILEKLKSEQQKDFKIKSAIDQLDGKGIIETGIFRKYDGMIVTDGILRRDLRIIVPAVLQREIIALIHDQKHLGVENTFHELKTNCFWKGMYAAVQVFCASCSICQKNKRSYKPREPIHKFVVEFQRPRHAIAMDIATLPWSDDGYRYFYGNCRFIC